jgi:hypothetical protein
LNNQQHLLGGGFGQTAVDGLAHGFPVPERYDRATVLMRE